MQGINAGNTCYPERAFSSRFCQQFFLIIIGNNKPAEDKKETDSDKSFFKEVGIETCIQNITMCSEYHQGKEYS